MFILEAAAGKFLGSFLLFDTGSSGNDRATGKGARSGKIFPTCRGLRATTVVIAASEPRICETCITIDGQRRIKSRTDQMNVS